MIFNFRKREKVKIAYLSIGLILLFLGISALLEEPELKMRTGFPYSDRWGVPVHNHAIGAVILIFSLTWIIPAFFKLPGTKIKKRQKINSTHICISCGDLIAQESQDDSSCRKCGGKVESIKGVLDRHPELINKLK